MQELKELKTIINNNKGGTQVFTKYSVTVGDNLWNQLYSNIDNENYSLSNVLLEGNQLFAVLQSRSDDSKYSRMNFSLNEGKVENISEVEEMAGFVPLAETQFAQSDVEAFEASFNKKKEEDEDKNKQTKGPNSDKNTGGDTSKSGDNNKDGEGNGDNNPNPDNDDEDEKNKNKCKYNLEEIPEYIELSNKYSALQTDYDSLKAEVESLRAFKLSSERTQKQEMIDKFYMLSDEDKKDVTDNIDKYSLDDIEAKLSVICVRNKVNFNLDDEHKDTPPTTFNFNGEEFDNVSTPAWVKAAMEVEKEMK